MLGVDHNALLGVCGDGDAHHGGSFGGAQSEHCGALCKCRCAMVLRWRCMTWWDAVGRMGVCCHHLSRCVRWRGVPQLGVRDVDFQHGIVGGVDAEHVHSCVFGVRRHVEHICVQNQSKTMNPDTTLVGFVLCLTNDM